MIPYFILYVSCQDTSTSFYQGVLGREPRLNVPGMTEFQLPSGGILGLMPESGIKRLLGESLQGSTPTRGAPRAELYFLVENALEYHSRAIDFGAELISEYSSRPWGHTASYFFDPDGYVLAFASITDGSVA